MNIFPRQWIPLRPETEESLAGYVTSRATQNGGMETKLCIEWYS